MHAKSVTLIFPHQLFDKHPAVKKGNEIYLVEEHLYFNQYNFHKKKLVLHRASMKYYSDRLTQSGIDVKYIDATDDLCDVRKLVPYLAKKGAEIINYCDVADNWLEKRLDKACALNDITLVKLRTPNYLNSADDVAGFFDSKKTYFQTDFYIAQRKQRQILLESDGKPIGGKWTYDSENRSKFPKAEAYRS